MGISSRCPAVSRALCLRITDWGGLCGWQWTFESLNPQFRYLGFLYFQLSDEPVAVPGNGLNVPRPFGRVAKHFAELFYGRIQAIVRIHEGTRRPQPVLQLLAADDLAPSFRQQQQNLKGLVLQAHPAAVPPHFAGAGIHFEAVEPQRTTVLRAGCHQTPRSCDSFDRENSRLPGQEEVSGWWPNSDGALGFPPSKAQV
jgi:hypothetical protein